VLTLCWAAKGGNGATVVSCALAVLAAREHGGSLLVDLGGDAPAALGMTEQVVPGVHDWVTSSTAPSGALSAIAIATAANVRVIPSGRSTAPADHPRWGELGRLLAASDEPVFVDACTPGPPLDLAVVADRRLLVIRPCYLALRRAVAAAQSLTGVVIVNEPGRALRSADVVAALQVPVVAEISCDPAIWRAVDSGLLLTRLPKALQTSLQDVVK